MRLFIRILVLIFVLSFTMIFSAQESMAAHALFEDIDKNEDGRIDSEEFSEDMKENVFERLDADKDNTITDIEWAASEHISGEAKFEDLFRKIDKDRDKKITFFEFSDYADSNSNIMEAFIGLDKDGSNSLSPDEISTRPVLKILNIKF